MTEYEPLITDQRLIEATEPLRTKYPSLHDSDFFTYVENAHPAVRNSGLTAIQPPQAVFCVSSPHPKHPERRTVLQAKTTLAAFRAAETERRHYAGGRDVVSEAFRRLAREQARRLADLRDLLPPTPEKDLPS